jgi:septal ring factor EnvC (AmiA/AmiB activator)
VAQKREFNILSMSFLDAITCAFACVILVYMIITANFDTQHETKLAVEQAEVDRVKLQVIVGGRNLAQLKDELERLVERWATSRGVREEIAAEITRTREELESVDADTEARREMIEQLRKDLALLEVETENATAAISPTDAGNRIRSVRGEGTRQYLTGMRMGGERIVVLVDVSTSMLDRTLVNILRRRNMPP